LKKENNLMKQEAKNLLKKVFQQKAMILRNQYDGFCFFILLFLQFYALIFM